MVGRCAPVHRKQAPTLGGHFQPQPLAADLRNHAGPLLVRLAGAEAPRTLGPQPLLHQRLLPVTCQTILPLGQAPDQALRLVRRRCIYDA